MNQTAHLFDIARVSTTASPSCLAHYPGQNGWKCIYGQYALPFVRSSYLLHSYLYDQFQLSGNLAIPFVAWPHTAQQLHYTETFRNLTTTIARTLQNPTQVLSPGQGPVSLSGKEEKRAPVSKKEEKVGARHSTAPSQTRSALLAACYAHCATEDSRWTDIHVDGISLDAAVTRWWQSLGQEGCVETGDCVSVLTSAPDLDVQEGSSSFVLLDNCTGFNCGEGCPQPPA
eukprot:m.225716 g.225716  ORF g.225716 m.225716 type:complete len:229 (+) comp16768_c0_seq1:1372-2058(+)